MDNSPTILLSRTDRIGDVVLTLPMAGWIKEQLPHSRIAFLCRSYTAPVVARCRHVDRVVEVDAWDTMGDEAAADELRGLGGDAILHVFPDKRLARLAKRAGVPERIGTNRRAFHWLTCNRRVNLSRKGLSLHEAQLNLKLLEPLGLPTALSREAVGGYYGLESRHGRVSTLPPELDALLDPERAKIILHPGSGGSAVEWPLIRFAELSGLLLGDRCQVLVTGTAGDRERVASELPLERGSRVHDLMGTLDLGQLIELIGSCDALVAASTGPLHIAAALGKRAVGLYSNRRPIDPGRWGPLGPKAVVLTGASIAQAGDPDEKMRLIPAGSVLEALEAPG